MMRTIRAVSMAALAMVLVEAVSASEKVARGQFSGAMETTYPDWFKLSFMELQDDVGEAREQGRRVLLLFHQDGCPYCNALVERNLSQKDIEEVMREKFDVIAINMWGDRDVVSIAGVTYTEKTFSQALKVQFTPTMIFLDESGKAVLRLNGYLPPRRFKAALDYAASRSERELSYRDYVARELPPSASDSGGLIAEPYFKPPPYALARGADARPLAVLFEQRDCPNCETLHDKVLADSQTHDLLRQFDVVQLDMWADTPVETPDGRKLEARTWARELGVSYAPSILFFDGKGREVIRSEAWFRIFHTQSMMDYVLSGAHREEPSFQRYISARAEALRERGISVDIWR